MPPVDIEEDTLFPGYFYWSDSVFGGNHDVHYHWISDDLLGAGASTVSRAFAGSIQPAYHYLEFFPEVQGYLMGDSFPSRRSLSLGATGCG